jgi:soluble lytic murein transglycosylase-like protein
MQTIRFPRLPLPLAAGAMAFALALAPSASVPSVPDPVPRPDLAEIRELQALAGWVTGRSPEAGDLRALRPSDLAGAMKPNERSFELFRHTAHDEARRRFLERKPFGQALYDTAARNRVDPLLLAAVVEAESRFTPDAVSPRGAVGLMQVLPATGRRYDAGDLRDPYTNLEIGSRYLGGLIDHYDGDLERALAAYNAGPAAVARYDGIPPYTETRTYVKKVLALYLDHSQAVQEAAAARLAALSGEHAALFSQPAAPFAGAAGTRTPVRRLFR